MRRMADSRQTIDDLGEFGFIRTIMDGCVFAADRLVQGIGDDCAVIGPYNGRALLVTTDMLVEDIHFILAETEPQDLGHKAMAVNFSDVAAMGGAPGHALVSIAVPGRTGLEVLEGIYKGMKTLCREHGVNIVGGDTCASPDRLVLNVVLLGEAPEGRVLLRSRAKAGDDIYVTGTLGDSAAGLMLIKGRAAASEPIAAPLRKAHHRPTPRVDAGRAVARSGLAGAMIDLSDGLASDLGHVCEASGVGARVFSSAIPLSGALREMAAGNGLDALELALYGGEDYQLLVTAPAEHRAELEASWDREVLGPLFRVGEMTGDKGLRLVRPGGREEALGSGGFDHFGRKGFRLKVED